MEHWSNERHSNSHSHSHNNNNMRVLFTLEKWKRISPPFNIQCNINKIKTKTRTTTTTTTLTKKIWANHLISQMNDSWQKVSMNCVYFFLVTHPTKTVQNDWISRKIALKNCELAIRNRSWPGFQTTTTKIIHRLLYFCLRFTFKLTEILNDVFPWYTNSHKLFANHFPLPLPLCTSHVVNG